MPPLFTEPGWNMHEASEIGIDDFQALRSPDERYRTSPLKGLFAHQKGGFYHDGRFATLSDVVAHYDGHFELGLSSDEQSDLVEYLKSLWRRSSGWGRSSLPASSQDGSKRRQRPHSATSFRESTQKLAMSSASVPDSGHERCSVRPRTMSRMSVCTISKDCHSPTASRLSTCCR